MSPKKRSFSVYQALRKALERQAVSQAGVTATLLLETFLEDSGRLKASKVYARELCPPDGFIEWRKSLIQLEWLVWNEAQSDKGQYFPGKKLLLYINKEKINQKEIATKEELVDVEKRLDAKADREEVRAEIDAVKKKLEKLESGLNKAISKFLTENPPHTKEREDKVRRNFEETGRLFVN